MAVLRHIRQSATQDAGGTQRPFSTERITPLAAALAAGIAIGWWVNRSPIWPWAALAGSALLAAAILLAAGRRGAAPLIMLAAAGVGAAWITVRQHSVAPDDLAALLDGQPQIVRVRGLALGPPVMGDRAAGSMALFDHRPPATYFDLRVTELVSRNGGAMPARGTVRLRVEETLAPFRAGDTVEATGFLYPPTAPLNPGEFDSKRYARSRGRAGLLSVPRRDLITVRAGEHAGIGATLMRWRDALRRRASAWLLSNLPETDRTQRDALLAALLLGQRGADADGLGESFRRVGLAHFLALSGLHLGVLAGFVLLGLRLTGEHRRWHGWLVIAVVLGYLVMVELRMPVLRAGVMTIAACLGLAAGRRLRAGALVSTSAIGLLLWRPDELFSPGFQLSYGVVLALLHLAPPVRRRLFGPPDALASSTAQMAGQWLRTACAASLTAWAVATPITLHHWGVLWPLAALFSVLALPVVTVVLAVGYVKMVLSVVLPSAALLAGVPLSFAADVLISLVQAMDAVPLSSVRIGHPPAVWSVAAEGWICALVALASSWPWVGRAGRRALGLIGLVLLGWLLWPLLPWSTHGALRIDMLAVGDGSCYLLRSGADTVVFDAGSSSDLDAGRRVIVPAMQRLGVRSIDAIVVSHPNLDHYSAVIELVDAFGADAVLVTPHLLGEAAAEPSGPVMFLLDALASRSVPVVEVAAGEQRRFGESLWTWRHPDAVRRYESLNDTSMVVTVEAAGRRVLLCGDVQREAIASLLDGGGAGGSIAADVVELPHHGSFNGSARSLVAAADPRYVLQSTGPSRWRRTREDWEPLLHSRQWLVSTTHGACWIRIDRDGSMASGSFRDWTRGRQDH